MSRTQLGRYGFSLDVDDDGTHLRTAQTLQELGFGTLWINGGQLDRLDRLTDVLKMTTTAHVGSAIIPPDRYPAAEVLDLFRRAEVGAPGRLVIGLGTSHQPKPLTRLGHYLDELCDVPADRMLLAAMGSHALELARDRFAGTLPMLFTEEHTAWARRIIGADRTLAVGLYAVLNEDPTAARAIAREPLTFLTTMPAYRNSLQRQGFSAVEIDSLSDHLVDTLVAWGSPRRILDHAARLHAAGADHVRFTVLGADALGAARMLAAESD
ncbi:TIGR03620 family F420-dependent LLM class oxidoreductase [Mycobacterium sp. SMC-4]|uniref:TIGR03620 family F420-dependent LLM class oxidoreductase n=1 Tax=Mycobacterium sp. SMC-4 TaxID=2857059 RepID=UPI003CFCAE6A